MQTLYIKSFEIWTDCEELVNSLNKSDSANTTIRTTIRDIDGLLRNLGNVRILHVSRNKVSKAHNLALRERKEQL